MPTRAVIVKKPWFRVTLDRIDQKAREGSVAALQKPAERIISSILHDQERAMIVAELDVLVRVNAAVYDAGTISYLQTLKTLRSQTQRPWYAVMLDQLAEHAKNPDPHMTLRELVQDFRSCETNPDDRVAIIRGLERIVRDERAHYPQSAIEHFELLLDVLRGGF